MKAFKDIYSEFVSVKKNELLDIAQAKAVEATNNKLQSKEAAILVTLVNGVIKADGVVSAGEQDIIKKYIEGTMGKEFSFEEALLIVKSTTDEEIAKAVEDFKSLPDKAKEDMIFVLLTFSSADGFIAKEEYSWVKKLVE